MQEEEEEKKKKEKEKEKKQEKAKEKASHVTSFLSPNNSSSALELNSSLRNAST